MSVLRRLRRVLPASAASTADITTRLDAQARLIESLVKASQAQAKELKALAQALSDANHGWQTSINRLGGHHAHEARDVATNQRRAGLAFQEAMDRQAAAQQHEAKWRTTFSRQMSAVIRRLFLPADLPYPFRLTARRFSLRSQFDEDGLILALLDEVGVVTRRFVEIGSGRSGGNSAALALDMGWAGLMIDSSETAIHQCKQRFALNPGVSSRCAFVYPENVNDLLTEHGYNGDVDVLSIDIDSYDYWVLEALQVTRPRLLVLEYNAAWGPERAVTIPYPSAVLGRPKGYFGASLAALTAAANRKGYRLVLCDDSGVNAFYLRNDLAPHVPELPVAQAFRAQMSRVNYGEQRPDREIYRLVQERGLAIVEV